MSLPAEPLALVHWHDAYQRGDSDSWGFMSYNPFSIAFRRTAAAGCLIHLSLLTLFAVTAFAGGAPDFSGAAAILRRGIEGRAFPGCTVVVGTADTVLWSAAFGSLDYSRATPVTCATLYDQPTGRLAIYYGGADTVTALAFSHIDEMVNFVRKNAI